MDSTIDVFISAASDEFEHERTDLHDELRRSGISVMHQGILPHDGRRTLEKLDAFVERSELVVHILGHQQGSRPRPESVAWLRSHRAALSHRLAGFDLFGELADRLSYTQWEAWLALLHGKNLMVTEQRPSGADAVAPDPKGLSMAEHAKLLAQFEQGRESRRVPWLNVRELALLVTQAYLALAGPSRASSFVWPQPASFGTYVEEKREGFVGRAWVLQRIEDWCAGGVKRVMLIRAPFGVGKSALMAKLLSLRDPQLTEYHFCRFDEQDTLEPGKIVRSLAAQFAANLQAYRDVIETNVEARLALEEDAALADPAAAWLRGMMQPLRSLEGADRPPQHLLIVDALDESLELHGAAHPGGTNPSPDAGKSLLGLVLTASASRLPDWLRVIVTSRDREELGARIQDFEVIDLLAGQANENAADLAAFVGDRLREDRMRQLLAQAGIDEVSFVTQLVEQCGGKFLLAHYLMEEAKRPDFDAKALRKHFMPSGRNSGIDGFFTLSFERRVPRAGFAPEMVKRVLGIIVVALDPLPEAAIAQVLGLDLADVHRIVRALSGLLRHNAARGGITFDHFSIEQWLDAEKSEGIGPDGLEKAGAYAIERGNSMARLCAHCSDLAKRPEPLVAAGAFKTYLMRFGVVHLLDAGELGHALALLSTLFDEQEKTDVFIPARAHADRVIEAIKVALHAIDWKARDAGAKAEAAGDTLRGLPGKHLRALLLNRDYETDKFEPVIRVLVAYHPQAWPEIQARLLRDDDDNDIVLRHDIGVARAEAWHAAAGDDRQRLLDDIIAMARDRTDGHAREIAGYALKHICQRRDGKPWWQLIDRATIKALAGELALSIDAVDRLVAGEMLLALTLQGVAVDEWLAPSEELARIFWEPRWGNHRADVDAIRVVLAEREKKLLCVDDPEGGLASCIAQYEFAESLRHRLREDPLFRRTGELARLRKVLSSAAEQQSDRVALEESIKPIERLLDGEHRESILDMIRLLMLHPLWNETERAANLVAKLVKRQVDKPRWFVIDALMASDPLHTRLRYGAIDSAYTAGSVDGFGRFKTALLRCGKDTSARVRGIAADDLRRWVIKDSDHAQRCGILGDPSVAELIRFWLAKADDQWLLEYLHGLFSDLIAISEYDYDEEIAALMPDRLTSYLDVGGQPFYTLGYDDFMQRIELHVLPLAAPPLRRL